MLAFQTRPLAPSDLDLVVRHREQMFREMGFAEANLEAMTRSFRPWLQPRLEDGRYFGWVIEVSAIPVAGIGIIALDWAPPHPLNPDGAVRAYILNVFVEPEYRGNRFATFLMQMAADEAKRRGIRFMTLHASSQGRPVYEKLGWASTTEMAITLPE